MITYYTKESKFLVEKYNEIPYNILHKLNGPAIEYKDGRKEWRVNGKKHRLDGPAVTTNFGTKQWWVNGKLHRLNGPAIVWHNGDKEWWANGKRYRLDGPAIEFNDGCKYWYINDKELNKDEVEDWIKDNNINLKTKQHQVLFMVVFG